MAGHVNILPLTGNLFDDNISKKVFLERVLASIFSTITFARMYHYHDHAFQSQKVEF